MKIVVFGTGAYGIGLATMLAKKKENEIMLWTENVEKEKEFLKIHRFDSIFPNIEMPDNISITTDFEKALKNAKLIFLVTSVKYILSTCKNIMPFYNGIPICIAAKGIDTTSLSLLSNLVKKTLNTNNICVISGPTFAIDLINNDPCALAIAGLNKKSIKIVKENLANKTLKLRESSDIIGIQLCGSIKNIIAIAAGILSGLGYSESTRSFLINETLHDMKHTIHALGGKRKTILSFAGIGDLMLTCSSEKSRNYSFGYVIGRFKDKRKTDEYLKNNTVEGYNTLKAIINLNEKNNIHIDLFYLINDIIDGKKNPEELVTYLINKE